MKKILGTLAALAFSLVATSAIARPVAGACNPSDITGAYACTGGLVGNDLGNAANLARVGQAFADLGGFDDPFTLIDSSDTTRGSQIALIYETGGSTGRLLLEDPTSVLNFSVFGISLKAGNFHSLYLFDGGILSATEVLGNLSPTFTSLNFTTAGTALNHKGMPQGLSHAALWGFAPSNFGGGCLLDPTLCDPVSEIPEPATLALLATGLVGIALTTRRRRQS